MATENKLKSTLGVSLLSCDDGNFFNLSRFKVETLTQKGVERELRHADDAAALCASSPWTTPGSA